MQNILNEIIKIIEQESILTDSGKASNECLLALSKRINDLILNDFEKLILLLYRLDVNEAKVIQLLKDYPHSDAGSMIATLIIERQLQKIKTRKTFRQGDFNIDEDEKW